MTGPRAFARPFWPGGAARGPRLTNMLPHLFRSMEEAMQMTCGVIRAPRWLCTALVFLCVLTLVPAYAHAQAVSGTILGTVTDSTGSVVPGATVTIVNTGTGLTRTVTTEASGEFTAPQVPTGKYSVTAELTGFKKVTMENIDVGVDQRVRVDVKLELGAMTEAVTITAAAPLLHTY